MEHLFSPCARLFDEVGNPDLLGGQSWEDFELLQELKLDVSTEELLSAERAFTYEDLYAMLGSQRTLAWLTPHANFVRMDQRAAACFYCLPRGYRLIFNVDGQEISLWARSSEALSEILDIVRRLLVADVREVYEVTLRGVSRDIYLSINAISLAYLMEQCQSLKVLTFFDLEMNENHLRVLGTYSRPGLEIVLVDCAISDAGASAFAEILGRNQGPTKLDQCDIDNLVLANGLRGNSRLKSLTPRFSGDLEVRNRELLAIAGALQENKGLVDLDLDLGHVLRMSDESWDAVCGSLKTHPTLEVLDLRRTFMDPAITPAVLKSQIQALLDMMKRNMSIHTIHLDAQDSQHELYRESVIPYLDTNRFRPRLLAIQQTRPIPYRAKVLGRALLSARTNTNSLWILLSGNAEVAFPSTTATTGLPTPATTAAATSNVAAAAATAAAAVSVTRAASASAATVATPTAHPKRKAHP
jgi:hypothetical protein